ncbi:type I-E CRISPR-associated protein Cas6/Cse3/CasE [Haloechinothrix sp. YIM 98757]|uniref:Type I-E CRISPR-associated protein Cas6/Cse3/CasE n=1 Tax=Haloechinothrix aidingensis TaxID=2752311 RepID=A0A838ADJ9_9PSEU|nr:type I-E CRISPR-associated protein Cas6/Cse3/CasE [Haloechinothrix aidingensis]MBA0127235.1 type I-E CRISPR-associated protein Cas6/Cse3/CasE [Haloechinothrix aidingensis]
MELWLTEITVRHRFHAAWHGEGINGDRLHRELMRLVPADLGDQPRRTSGLLFRAEPAPDQRNLRILAQTCLQPRPDMLADEFADAVRTRPLSPLLETLQPGMRVRYRIAANPTKRHGNTAEPEKRGRLATLRGSAADDWWLRRAEEAGLQPQQVLSTSLPDVRGAQHRARHGVVRFDGTAVVTDADQLRETLADGIGRAKSYGCGMLSLGPER